MCYSPVVAHIAFIMLVFGLGLFPFSHVYHVAQDGEEPDGPGDDPAADKGQ